MLHVCQGRALRQVLGEPDPALRHPSRPQIRIGDLQVARRLHRDPGPRLHRPLDGVHAAMDHTTGRQPGSHAVEVGSVGDHDVHPLEPLGEGGDVHHGDADRGRQPRPPFLRHLQRDRTGARRQVRAVPDDGHQLDEVTGKVHVRVGHPERLGGAGQHGMDGRRHGESQPAIQLHGLVDAPHDVPDMVQAVDVTAHARSPFMGVDFLMRVHSYFLNG